MGTIGKGSEKYSSKCGILWDLPDLSTSRLRRGTGLPPCSGVLQVWSLEISSSCINWELNRNSNLRSHPDLLTQKLWGWGDSSRWLWYSKCLNQPTCKKIPEEHGVSPLCRSKFESWWLHTSCIALGWLLTFLSFVFIIFLKKVKMWMWPAS